MSDSAYIAMMQSGKRCIGATGSTDINNALSGSRADFIANELISRGVLEANIRRKSNGGIDDFAPNEVNRHTKVELFFKH